MKSTHRIIIILAVAIALIAGLSVASYAAWTAGSTTVNATGVTGSISSVGVEISNSASELLGTNGKLYPFSQPNVEEPDRNMLKIVFTEDVSGGGVVAAYNIHTQVALAKTADDYITLYYWNRTGVPNLDIAAANIGAGNGWTAITTSATAISAADITTSNDTNTLYIAFDTQNMSDMNKLFQITISAV